MQASEDLRKRILVVEDESLIAADLERRIARPGHSGPAIAHFGEEALAGAKSTRFDLAVMDVRLKGGVDGVAAAVALQSELRTPVVYVKAQSDKETIERAKFTEPLGYLPRPISGGDLPRAPERDSQSGHGAAVAHWCGMAGHHVAEYG
jgi:CheY-like chemotaxis protein